ncbi:hypothetical protein FA95DRAFT_1675579 [Auriscalpium vulgare]|uniref:Uncharacterized protein n=1 Tax=Auriscalpium vulgare TaxID=40419 RepID=A0ACB8S6N2_9AGAM|nr:hypothetical protein FA95DRAFT_1675579 [Auriscalpium vulgare]
MIDYLLLAATILIVIAVLLYLFFWNKCIGFLIGLVFRVAYWNKGGDSAYVHIGSFHFSLLAGRILFKNFHYHSASQTIKIVRGELTWRYWLRAPTLEEDLQARTAGEDARGKSGLRKSSCRIHGSFEGFEWYLYNRTSAFDAMLEQMYAKAPDPRAQSTDNAPTSLRHIFSKSSGAEAEPLYPPSARPRMKTPDFLATFLRKMKEQLPNYDPKSLLPASFECLKGAIICGNHSTPSLLIAEFSRAESIFGTVPSKSPMDLYRQLLNIKFEGANVSMVENDQFIAPMLATGEQLKEKLKTSQPSYPRGLYYLVQHPFSKLWSHAKLGTSMDTLRDAVKSRRNTTPTPTSSFRNRRKRAKSIEMETPFHSDFTHIEYVVERKILEAPSVEMSYYVDAAGVVPHDQRPWDLEGYDIGNGGGSPEWGLDLVVNGGFIRYGPWADRQRAELQRAFFPPTYQDTEETPRLGPGDNRIWTAMRVFVELRGGTTVQIPFREPSKDWIWDGLTPTVSRPRKREGATLSIKAGDDSTISYFIPMIACPDGYHPLLEVHLDTVTVSSSLNDIRLLTAESCRVSGNMHSPLKWNDHREWLFAISLRQPTLYLLRDHINMLTDLGKDWSTGPPSDFAIWVPMRYKVNVDLRNFEINTYVNDHNIIDKPLLRDENALMTIRGPMLRNENVIASDKFRPNSTSVPFTLDAPDVIVDLTFPKWSAHKLHATEPITRLLQAGSLRLDGSYLYFAEVQEDNIEQLRLNFSAREVVFKCLGWSIRYFMILRDNYFGAFTHFSTLREYLENREKGLVGDPIIEKYRPGKSNQLQVELQLAITQSSIILPCGLPGYETFIPLANQHVLDVDLGSCITLAVPELELQLRSHDYAMEMSLNVGALYCSIDTSSTERRLFQRPKWRPEKEAFVVDKLDVVAHRLFGPQPKTATYVCMWEIDVGDIKGVITSVESRAFKVAMDAFVLNYRDPLDAPATRFVVPSDPDVTFLKLTLEGLDMTWTGTSVSVQALVPRGVHLEMNDLAGNMYRRVTSVRIPEAVIRFLHATGAQNRWIEAGEVTTDVMMDMYSRPPGWSESALAQEKFLSEQDVLTNRLHALHTERSRRRRLPARSGLYTGPLRLPRPAHHRKWVSPELDHSDPRDNDHLTKPTPWPQRGPYVSDSDGEDSHAETDRDLRLARSRPISMATEFDSESMASGDESDDADLTDDDGFDSEWSDDNSSLSRSTMARYHRYSRLYTFDTSARPSFWDEPPVNLVKDYRPSIPPAVDTPPPAHSQHTRQPFDQWSAENSSDQHDSTSVRLHIQTASVWFTPILPPTLIQVLEEHSRVFVASEQRIDTLLAHRQKALMAHSTVVEDTLFDVHVQTLRIRAIQLVPGARDSPKAPSLLAPEVKASPSHELTAVDWTLDDCTVKGQTTGPKSDSKQSIAASVGHTSISLSKAGSRHPRMGRAPEEWTSILNISLSDAQCAISQTKANLAWNSFTVALEHVAPNYAVAIICAHEEPSLQAFHAYRQLRRDEISTSRIRIHNILLWSKEHSIVDPLSTIQPSYLIQTGRPHDLRVNAGVKVLIYLRVCLRSMDPKQHQAIREIRSGDDSGVSRERILRLLESQLTGLLPDGEPGSLTDTDLLTELYPRPQEDAGSYSPAKQCLESVTIDSRTLGFTIFDPSGGAASNIQLGPISVTAVLQKSRILPITSSKSVKDLSTPSRDTSRLKIQHVMLSVSVESVDLLILPHVLSFTQRLLRLRREFVPQTTEKSHSRQIGIFSSMDTVYGDLTFSLKQMRIQAAAEKLVIVFQLTRLAFVSSAFIRITAGQQGRTDISNNSSLVIDTISLQARSSTTQTDPTAQDALAMIAVKRAKISGVFRQELALSSTLRALLTMDDLRFTVPRSAIRLSRFIEEWRADYLPGIEETVQTIISEVRQEPKAQPSPVSQQHRFSTVHLQLGLTSCGISLHVMPGTWLSWEAFNIISYLRLGVTNSRKLMPTFGVQFSSQRISIMSVPKEPAGPSSDERLNLELPSMTVTGRYEDRGVHVLASIGLFHVTVKPSYLDTLLSVQQKFGQDFSDLVHFLGEARHTRQPRPESKQVKSAGMSLHSALLKVGGFRVGLEGHSSTVFLECQDINGGFDANHAQYWQLNVTGLALSLAPRAYALSHTVFFNGNHRSAFVIIDFTGEVTRRQDGVKEVKVIFKKTHAVLQPSSIGEIGDFVDNLQAEVLIRQEERARELAAFKEKTREVMRTFEVRTKESNSEDQLAWLDDYSIIVDIKNIGAAFPLEYDNNLELPRGAHQHVAVPAFLFSIKSVEFGAERNGHGKFTMSGFSFQFVNKFKQSTPTDFSGDSHQTRNRLLYPSMTAQLRSERSATSRRVRVGADVSGFILDVDSSITDHVFSLVDVYRRGKERVDKLTMNLPRSTLRQELKPKLEAIAAETQDKALPTSSMILSLVFQSGSVRMHSGTGMARSGSLHDMSDSRMPTSVAESFNLPIVSVWGEYRAVSATQKLTGAKGADARSLMFKSTVHSSQNTIRPTLLPFISELVNHVDVRMRKASTKSSTSTTEAARELISSVPSEIYSAEDDVHSGMQITFALRIDQSKLQLTCQPDVNVIAGMHWDSGGFVVNVSSGGRHISFLGNVAGLTIGLKHGFLSEDCVRLDARNLTFATTFSKHEQSDAERPLNSVSIVIDTEISGGVRFSRFQDVLCFKAVWLDRIPVFTGNTAPPPPAPRTPGSLTPGGMPSSKQNLTTAVLVRVRKMVLSVDLGQSISSVTFDMQRAVLRSKLQESSTEMSLSVADLRIEAAGNVSGHGHIPDFSFNTVRRKNRTLSGPSELRMLDMSLTSGALDLTLESDYQKILHLWAEPLNVQVMDDWSQMGPDMPILERLLRLCFDVSGTDLVAVVTVSTLPKLVSYAAKFKANLEIQKEGASRESKAFRITQEPRPDNPLSAFANAMLQSARSRLKKEDNFTYMVEQQVTFRLNLLRLAVFPRTMNDVEMAHFVARDLRANLDRIVADAVPITRKLQLAFASMATSRLSQLNVQATSDTTFNDHKQWFETLRKDASQSTIFDLPAMDINMESETDEKTNVIDYSFVSKFSREESARSQDDIFITLNVSLYSWLTLLRKNLSREMDQAKGAKDWRSGITPGNASSPRKKSNVESPAPESAVLTSPSLRPRTPTISIDTRAASLAMSPTEHKKSLSMSGSPPNLNALGPAFDLKTSKAAKPASGSASPVVPAMSPPSTKASEIVYRPRYRHIERLNMRQLGEATPDVMHPFFMKKAGFNLEDALPQYVNEYATMPIEEMTRALLRLYSKQLSSSGPHPSE